MPKTRPAEAEATPLPTGFRLSPTGAPSEEATTSAPPRDFGAPPRDADFPVVGIGASAGGLDACRRLVEALPKNNGMGFILVQHLDPTYQSMMVELLTGHTVMPVKLAADGMAIERDHLYVIPPGTYLSVHKGILRLTPPQARHGARLPFDFLLASLAQECGARAIAVVLSGTGADGSVGLLAVKAAGGFVVAQEPAEAEYDGMPRSAIATGAVDYVSPLAKIPAALAECRQRMEGGETHEAAMPDQAGPHGVAPDQLAEIIELLRTGTAHDFTQYKSGTLQRRIERRMEMAGIGAGDMKAYRDILRRDPAELDLLAKDLLINVTSFFRDSKVFELLETTIIPRLIAEQPRDLPLRVWVAGCSTGEEAYSLAMILREQLSGAKSRAMLQIFASDVDADAIDNARDGLYPQTIEANVSKARLARFFAVEGPKYRVLPELRSAVVFTVQDVLADPPFSRMDLISCRNLLIYMGPEAQANILSLFHFALRDGGILLLGSSETVGGDQRRFEVIAKAERLYRHIGRSRPGEVDFVAGRGENVRSPPQAGPIPFPSRQAALAETCRKIVMETYAPAAVLISLKHEVVYSLGPTDRYLIVPPGHPTHDLLAMARQGLRNKIGLAVRKAAREKSRAVITGCRINYQGETLSFSVDVQPVQCAGEDLLLVCFVDTAAPEKPRNQAVPSEDAPRLVELEQELEAKKTELRDAVRELEIANEEQKTINEEALSVSEEYQSTNEELVTSKEELQSLNEELTALNAQLQETLERQRTTSDDLQNVLYSTDVATLFLDTKLNIRFFTPATRLLFRVIPSDVGRPLADLTSLAADRMIAADARAVLRHLMPIDREIEADNGVWFTRRILPYRTHDNRVEGVVIIYTDITERKNVARALELAKQQADLANVAKSRFLAVASHDLRQPLQTLALLQGLLAKLVQGERAQKLVTRLDETLGAISSMLNTLLDINQIDAGTVHAEIVKFSVGDLIDRLSDEFTYHAQAQGLEFRVVSSSLVIDSDPRLLEQMIRNLLSNAFKYTRQGKVLLGCRRHEGMLRIEVLDTGVGIPASEFETIFGEYHQLDNAARERSRGLGLGLYIVQRLAKLLGHQVRVRSRLGRGSIFTIEIALPAATPPLQKTTEQKEDDATQSSVLHTGTVLIVEDDPDVRELLEQLLIDEGHRVEIASDAGQALELVARRNLRPDLLLTDYNLPNGLNGLELTIKLRDELHVEIPGIILTGDISTDTLRDISLRKCVRLNKPVRLAELSQAIQRLLPLLEAEHQDAPATPGAAPEAAERALVFVVDDDGHVRGAIRSVLEDEGHKVEEFPTSEAFLAAFHPGGEACLLIDAYLPGMGGIELLKRLREAGHHLPSIMITGNSDVPMAVEAMKAGASDFIEKPIGRPDLLAAIERALEQSRDQSKMVAWHEKAANHVADLTPRQREIMDLVLAGHPSKNIAADLGISQRTVENHRASIMKKTGSKSLPALARLALAAAWSATDDANA